MALAVVRQSSVDGAGPVEGFECDDHGEVVREGELAERPLVVGVLSNRCW